MIEVSLLGPPRVEHHGHRVAFDTRKAMALLAHLALTDRPRPRDALADLLWPDADPERARGALRRTLSSLRSAIGAESLEATRDHVLLVRGPHIAVDVDRFRLLRATGDPESAVDIFRGELLEGFAVRDAPDFETWVRAESDALSRELASALSDLASLREAAGDRAGAVQAVRRWLALDPLHEPAHRRLVRLYALNGDRAAALVQYRECVRTLSRELGVPPLAETTRLYEAVNAGVYDPPEPARATAKPVPTVVHGVTADARTIPLVGRSADLGALRAAYAAIEADGRIAVVEGEAGIGKTRLGEELVTVVRGGGARVLLARCYEDEAGLAYAPLVDALRVRLREGRDWLDDIDEHALAQAAALVPELVVNGASGVAGAADDGPGAQTRFLSGLWTVLVAATAGPEPGVLWVDDGQWADAATLGLLAYGLRRLTGRPLLVMLSWRTPNDHPLRRVAIELAGTSGSVRRLERLDRADVDALVEAVRPGERSTFPQRLWAETEGVPLLLVEYLRTIGSDSDQWDLPAKARDVLRARIAPVSETGRQILSAAAVIGRAFEESAVRAVSGRADEETVQALEELVGRGLIREGQHDYDFGHEALRTLTYEETSLARRRLLHGRAADVAGDTSGAVARHLQLAGRDEEAARAYLAAGEQARSVFANAEALGHLQVALALGHPDRTRLLTGVGDLQTMAGDYAGALTSFAAAAALAGPGDLGRVERRQGQLQQRRGEWGQAVAHLSAALAATPDIEVAERAGITAELSQSVGAQGDLDRARSLAQDARGLAEKAEDLRTRCQAHGLIGMLAHAEGDMTAALVDLERSRELADLAVDPELQVAALNNLALVHRADGDLQKATELTSAALVLCTARGDRHREAALHNNLADLHQESGRHEEAMDELKAAVAIFAEIGDSEDLRPEVWKLVSW